MSIKEKSKEFFEKNKGIIGVVAGAATTMAVLIVIQKIRKVPGEAIIKPIIDSDFKGMTIAEIKKMLKDTKDCFMADALVIERNGVTDLIVRP